MDYSLIEGQDGRPARAFEDVVPDVPDVPVKVPPLPRPKSTPKAPRWRCDRCGERANDPRDLCEPVPVS